MPLPRGSKAGPEHLTKRDAEGADSSSVRAHLSLSGFSVIDIEGHCRQRAAEPRLFSWVPLDYTR